MNNHHAGLSAFYVLFFLLQWHVFPCLFCSPTTTTTTASAFSITPPLPFTNSPISNTIRYNSNNHSNEEIRSKKQLFPYQKEGVNRLITNRRLLLADEMGLGKTVQAISALNALFQNGALQIKECRILVICPKSVLSIWSFELQSWLNDDIVNEIEIVMPPPPKKKVEVDFTKKGIIQLLNYDKCHKYKHRLQKENWDVLICDEAHYLKSISSQRTRAILGDCDWNDDDKKIKSIFLWMLTGTPMMNRPVELYPLVHALHPDEFSESYDDFVSKYCDPKQMQLFGGRWSRTALMDVRGSANLGKLSQRLQPIMLRRYKADVLSDLPPKLRSIVKLVENNDVVKMEQQMLSNDDDDDSIDYNWTENNNDSEEDAMLKSKYSSLDGLGSESSEALSLISYLNENKISIRSKSSNQILGKIAKTRREIALLKLQPAISLLRDAILSHKVVVFAHHRAIIQHLMDEFGTDVAVCIMGGMDDASRAESIHRFQNDEHVKLFVGSIRASGVGVTLTAASHVVFLEMDLSPAIMVQAEDRCHRIGQQDSVYVQYYVFEDTIDEWIVQKLLEKQGTIDRAIMSSSLYDDKDGSGAYVLDFGKHKGLRLEDVPEDYLRFVIGNENIWQSRPPLWSALYHRSLVDKVPPHLKVVQRKEEKDEESKSNSDHSDGDFPTGYIFDFGKYKGLPLEDVPDDYLEFVVDNKNIWQSRSSLWRALYQRSLLNEEPPQIKIVKNMKQAKRDDTENNTGVAGADVLVEYMFDFGKYKGLHIEDVPEDYLIFIIENENVWQSRPNSLWRALFQRRLISEEPPHSETIKANEKDENNSTDKNEKIDDIYINYVFDFGKHQGKQWNEVPLSYREWIIQNNVWKTQHKLREALAGSGHIQI